MKRIIALVTTIALVAPAAAMAQSSTCQAYNSTLCTNTQINGSTANGNGSTLPFTGLDSGLLLVVGGGLLASGVIIRRAGRTRDLN